MKPRSPPSDRIPPSCRFLFAVARPRRRRRRGAHRLSGASLSRDRPSRHLDGRLVAWLDVRFNRADAGFATRRAAGVSLCLYLSASRARRLGGDPRLLAGGAPVSPLSPFSPRACRRSAACDAMCVRSPTDSSWSREGRRAVAKIVGRNPNVLDEAGVARAAIESLAENFSDGVVAPILWTALGGLAGGALYKAINTADSMIGHKTSATKPSAGRPRGSTISSICRRRGSPRSGSCWPPP